MSNTILINRKLVEDVFDRLDWDLGWIRSDYSGRAQYGASQFALALGSRAQGHIFLVWLAIIETEQDTSLFDNPEMSKANELAERVQTDSLGFGTIVYFPGVELVDD